MKLFFYLLSAMFIIYPSYSQDYSEKLIAYWSFEDSTAKDFSGNGYHGMIQNDVKPVIGRLGTGTAFRFKGFGMNSSSGGHILLPMIDFNNYTEFTISMWVKEESVTYIMGEAYIWFGDHIEGHLSIDHAYTIPDTTQFVNFTAGTRLPDVNNLIRYKFDYKNDRSRWVFYCMSYNMGVLSAYVDGKLIGYKPMPIDIHGTNAAIARHWWHEKSTSTRFTGDIDDVKIYSIALTKEEIEKEMLNGGLFEICENEKVILKAPEGFNSYEWSNGEVGKSTTVSEPGEYTVTVVNDENKKITSKPYVVKTKDVNFEGINNIEVSENQLLEEFIQLKYIVKNNGNNILIIKKADFNGNSSDLSLISGGPFPVSINAHETRELIFEIPSYMFKENKNNLIFEISEPCEDVAVSEIITVDEDCDETAFEFADFASTDNLVFLGEASPIYEQKLIKICPAKVNKTGAVWYGELLPIRNGFETTFSFKFNQGNNGETNEQSYPGADGLAFVIQNSGLESLGGNGGRMGYDGIENSLVVEIDLFSNDSSQIINFKDPNGNHIAAQSNGLKKNRAIHNEEFTLGISKDMPIIPSNGKKFNAKIDYNIKKNTLRAFISDNETFGKPVLEISDLEIEELLKLESNEFAYVGFTSATGIAFQNHYLLSWKFCPKPTSTTVTSVHSYFLNENENNLISLFPNPVEESVLIGINNGYSGLVDIEILDICGQIEYKFAEIVDNNSLINRDLSVLAPGVYFIRIKLGEEVYVKQLVKF